MTSLLYLQNKVTKLVFEDINKKVIGEYPIFGYFSRLNEISSNRTVEMLVNAVISRVGSAKGPNGVSELIESDGGTTTLVTIPDFAWKYPFTEQDYNVLQNASTEFKSNGAEESPLQTSAAQILARAASMLLGYYNETFEYMCSNVLRGSLNYFVGDTQFSLAYPVPIIAQPALSWDDAAAPIVQDAHRILNDFDNNANGTPADRVFISANTFNTMFIGNTEFMSFVKAVPALAQQFVAVDGDAGMPFDVSRNRTIPLFGRVWHLISGNVRLPDGTSVPRWPDNTMALLATTKNGLPTVSMARYASRSTPNGLPIPDSYDIVDPDQTVLRLSANGVPKLHYSGVAQVCTVTF